MGRMIDADALIDKLKRTSAFGCVRNAADKNVFEIIDEQPTAYDVEKVVAELENAVESYCSDYHGVDYIEPERAIEIVKRGGVE